MGMLRHHRVHDVIPVSGAVDGAVIRFVIAVGLPVEKRKVDGEIGARLADFVIVTSDNPRTEKPEAIIDDILVGLKGYDTPYAVIPDRVAAIHYAMDHAQPGDVIVLAGKGHEDYQEIDHKHYPMDERVIVAEHLKETQK